MLNALEIITIAIHCDNLTTNSPSFQAKSVARGKKVYASAPHRTVGVRRLLFVRFSPGFPRGALTLTFFFTLPIDFAGKEVLLVVYVIMIITTNLGSFILHQFSLMNLFPKLFLQFSNFTLQSQIKSWVRLLLR